MHPLRRPRRTVRALHVPASTPPSPPRSTAPSQPIPPPLGPSYHVPSRLLASSASSRSVRPPCPATGRPPGPRHAASESRPWPRPCSGSWACPAPACRWQREASDRWSVSESTGHLPSLWGRQPTTLGEEASHPGAACGCQRRRHDRWHHPLRSCDFLGPPVVMSVPAWAKGGRVALSEQAPARRLSPRRPGGEGSALSLSRLERAAPSTRVGLWSNRWPRGWLRPPLRPCCGAEEKLYRGPHAMEGQGALVGCHVGILGTCAGLRAGHVRGAAG